MAANAGTLEITITGNSAMLKKAVGIAKGELGGLRSSLRGLERGLGSVSDLSASAMIPTLGFLGALSAFVGLSVNTFSEQEQALSQVSTVIDGTSEEVQATTDALAAGVESISEIVPKPIEDLTSALYEIVAAGVPAEDAIGMLKTAGILASAGMGTATESAKLLTETMNAYGLSADDAETVSNVLYETIRDGKTSVSALSASFGDLAMIAAPMGVSLNELAAAEATLTRSGRSTSEASSELSAILTDLQKPGQNLEDVLNVLGVESGPRFDESLRSLIDKRGLVNVLSDISSTGEDMGFRMNELFGSVSSVNDIVALTTTKGDTFKDTLKDIETQSALTGDKVSNLDEKFNTLGDDVSTQTQKMQNALDGFLSAVGEGLVGIAYSAMSGIGSLLGIYDTATGLTGQYTTSGAFKNLMHSIGIPGFAEGGVVRSPTLAMVGERGPEAIVPLSGGGFPGTVTISPTIVIERVDMSSERGIEETARMVASILSSELREGMGA